MKLASLNNSHSRDGVLCIISKDLNWAVYASPIAQTLQEALEKWDKLEKPLKELAERLEQNQLKHRFKLDLHSCCSPLPRAYQWLDGSVYLNHVELVRKSRGVAMPVEFLTSPLMYQGGSDLFLSPHAAIPLTNLDDGLDFEAEIAIITDDVPMGTQTEEAFQHIKLLMLVNDISLRNVALKELTKGFGFIQSKPASSFSPIALTPDELGEAWRGGKVHLPIRSFLNETLFGQPNAGIDMNFSFAELIAHAAKTRQLGAGTIIGSGTVSNRDKTKGSSCIVERRTLEILEKGQASTPYLQAGDKVRIEMLDKTGQTLFGPIQQTVKLMEQVT